jgi:hypothetical protein
MNRPCLSDNRASGFLIEAMDMTAAGYVSENRVIPIRGGLRARAVKFCAP